VVFVFATTEPQKIAQTAAPVLSRLQRFDFRRIGAPAIRDRLRQVLAEEGIEADDDALTLIARQADGGMRDALSVLDQCLSFGEGRVTAQRVRDLLGLVGDELYASLLDVLARRDPAGVFPLLDRLEDAGADLVEFAAGVGEALRALLMLKVGARPEGLTEALEQALARDVEQFETGDLVRMLKLLGEAEAGLRRATSPRASVELLLLRWALLDRTVDLAEVLDRGGTQPAAPSGSSPGGASRPAERLPAISAPVPAQASVPLPAAGHGPEARAQVTAPKTDFTLDSLTAAWPDLVAVARTRSRFLGEAFAAARPTAAERPAVTLTLADGNPMHEEALTRQREAVERLLGEAVGEAVRVTLAGTAASGGGPAPKARRLSESEARAERLKVLAGRDPALGAAAEALDLEVLE
jgi:DNA polymerase-3 subunit gamma/tau